MRKLRVLVAISAVMIAGAIPAVASGHTVNSPGTSQVLHAGNTSLPAHGHLFGTADWRTDGVVDGQLNVGP
jgi:hypothetical protein